MKDPWIMFLLGLRKLCREIVCLTVSRANTNALSPTSESDVMIIVSSCVEYDAMGLCSHLDMLLDWTICDLTCKAY